MDLSRYGRVSVPRVIGALLLAGLVLMVRGSGGEPRDEATSPTVVRPTPPGTPAQVPAQADGTPARATPPAPASPAADQLGGDVTATPTATAAAAPALAPAPAREGASAPSAPNATPSATASPAADEEAPAPSPGEVAPAQRAAIGVTGDPIPDVPDSVAGLELSWRFPAPPNPAYRDRPFILVRGNAISAPQDWMHEQVAALIEAYHRYSVAQREALYARTTAPLQKLVGPAILSDVSAVVDRARERAIRYELQPGDVGVLAIDFEGRPADGVSASAYVWVHGAPVKIWNLATEQYVSGATGADVAVTGHLLPSWRMSDAGEWRLVDPGAPINFGEHSQRFITRHGPQFLPYYELNVEAREAAGLPSVDDALTR